MINYRKDNIWTVYLHIIPKYITKYDYDKYYVGITSKNVKSRWRSNGVGYFSQKYFYNAIQKYGWDNIEHYIIAYHLTKDEACNMEIKLIDKLHSNNKKYGYNLTNGGDGIYGYKFSAEQIQKMSEMRKGENNSFYGKHHTEDVKKQLSRNHYKCSGSNNPNAKTIYQFDVSGNFIKCYPSTVEASIDLKIPNWIATAASKKTSCYNYLWAREKDILFEKNNIILKNYSDYHVVKSTRKSPKKKKIYQFDSNNKFIQKYNSFSEASKITNIPSSTIQYNVKHKSINITSGFIWRYEEDVRESDEKSGSFYIIE